MHRQQRSASAWDWDFVNASVNFQTSFLQRMLQPQETEINMSMFLNFTFHSVVPIIQHCFDSESEQRVVFRLNAPGGLHRAHMLDQV